MSNITVTIDGKVISCNEGDNLLEVALNNGIYIPNLCHHPDLRPLGSCRMCLVEIEGEDELVTSCDTKARDGMVVTTKSPRIDKVRALSMELILTGHPHECTDCPKYGSCEMQILIQYLGVSNARLRQVSHMNNLNKKNPLIVHDMVRCIKCGRCVRACHDLRGVGVLDYLVDNKGDTYVGCGADLLIDEDCRFCCACVEVCPTSAIRDQEGLMDGFKTRAEALVPCKSTCPANTDVPRYLRYIREGRYADAVKVIRERVPFPAVLGNVCSHPCEKACRRGKVNDPVSIRNLKRYAELYDDKSWKADRKMLPATGKKVAVIGGGPAGLTAAYYLKKQGHNVTVFEALPVAGGMPRVGIPEYRMPSEQVQAEVDDILEIGVELKLNSRVNEPAKLLEEGYDAVLVAVGNHMGTKLPIPGNDLKGTLVNIEFLRNARLGNETGMGKKVVVLGGGNVAFDCARSAVRLGAEEVHVACLEARDKMTSDDEEIEQAQEEGIFVHPAQSFLRVLGEEKVEGIELINVESFTFDENRRAIIKTEEGSEHTIVADTIIFAVGQRPEGSTEFGLALGKANSVVADPITLQTDVKGVYAAGDVTYGTVSVIKAVAAGRQAASEIDKYLGGDGDIDEVLAPVEVPDAHIGKEKDFARVERNVQKVAEVAERKSGFTRSELPFECDAAACESGRCLQCDLRLQITRPKFWADFSNEKEA